MGAAAAVAEMREGTNSGAASRPAAGGSTSPY